MSDLTWTPVRVRLGQIKPWTHNPRMSTKAQAQRLIKSERELGQPQTLAVSPFVDGFCDLYDGHQRVAAWNTIKGADFEVWALQSNRPLDDDERRKISILLHTATGQWEWDKLAAWSAADLQEWGFDRETLQAWNNDANNLKEMLNTEQETQDAEPAIDRAAELQEKWQVSQGGLWQVGDHRLLCGDSTKREDVERVMGGEACSLIVTDPPYGVDYEGGANNEKKREKLDGDADARLYDAFLKVAPVADKCALYMWHAGQRATLVYLAAENNGFTVRSQIIWHKLKAHYGAWMAQYKQKHEPCIYCVKGSPEFSGATNEVTVWEYDQPSRNEFHPTEKPLELMLRAIGNHPYEVVFDAFCGSGTTLVACQNLGRRGRAIEISPAYVSVTLERMSQAFPGIEIKRIDT